MKITVPHMGNVYLAAKALFETLGIAYVIPQMNNKHTLQAGAAVSPEEICLPFKVMMGNYLEAIDRGADTILMVGSCGPCRFGEYCEVQMKLLKNLGKRVHTIVLDAPSQIGLRTLWYRAGQLFGISASSKLHRLHALRQALAILNLADETDAIAHEMAGYEIHHGQCKALLHACKRYAYACGDASAMRNVLTSYQKRLLEVPVDARKNPITVALVGEIFAMSEPFSNLYIEEMLMDYGVCSRRMLTPSWWLKDLAFKPLKLNSPEVKTMSRRYLPFPIGGHARESVAHAVTANLQGCDGVIQIFPLGCMPEIVTKAVLSRVQKDLDMPVLTLIVDEMTGRAGYVTRIEAFLDMIEAKKKRCAIEGNA